MKQVNYYLARVIKRANLTSEGIASAMQDSVTVEYRGTKYGFIDFRSFNTSRGAPAYYAKLAKYKQQGSVGVVREEHHTSEEAEVRNMIDAASPFVYLPEFSGLAYRNIWNKLTGDQFLKMFKELVESKHEKFFVGCDVEVVADLRTFVFRLAKIDKIMQIRAKVSPPNPLFGPCWKSLGDYMRKRNVAEVEIVEQSDNGIDTKLKEIATAVLNEEQPDQLVERMEPLLEGIGDAAILMATDGYGHGQVKGLEEGKEIVVRTAESQKSFVFDADPDPKLLCEHAAGAFFKINSERGLKHP